MTDAPPDVGMAFEPGLERIFAERKVPEFATEFLAASGIRAVSGFADVADNADQLANDILMPAAFDGVPGDK